MRHQAPAQNIAWPHGLIRTWGASAANAHDGARLPAPVAAQILYIAGSCGAGGVAAGPRLIPTCSDPDL